MQLTAANATTFDRVGDLDPGTTLVTRQCAECTRRGVHAEVHIAVSVPPNKVFYYVQLVLPLHILGLEWLVNVHLCVCTSAVALIQINVLQKWEQPQQGNAQQVTL